MAMATASTSEVKSRTWRADPPTACVAGGRGSNPPRRHTAAGAADDDNGGAPKDWHTARGPQASRLKAHAGLRGDVRCLATTSEHREYSEFTLTAAELYEERQAREADTATSRYFTRVLKAAPDYWFPVIKTAAKGLAKGILEVGAGFESELSVDAQDLRVSLFVVILRWGIQDTAAHRLLMSVPLRAHFVRPAPDDECGFFRYQATTHCPNSSQASVFVASIFQDMATVLTDGRLKGLLEEEIRQGHNTNQFQEDEP
jgi:hypothetical protein